MRSVDRRQFLQTSATAAGGAMLAPSLAGLIACNDKDPVSPGRTGYGELEMHPTLPFLIPSGFTLLQLSKAGDPLRRGGGTIPNAFDGMAALAHPDAPSDANRIRLIRNHEIRDSAFQGTAFGSRPYDERGGAGCTTIELEVDSSGVPHVVDEFVSLSGTIVNCAGGPTPWGSWLTCEETTSGTAQGFNKEHGYIFEIPSAAQTEVDPIPYRSMGRFAHEAVAVDPNFGHVYETEDAGNTSGFYRFIPNARGLLATGGRLQMLTVTDQPQLDTTGGGIPKLTPMPATWVDIDDPDPSTVTPTTSCFAQGLLKGGTRFARLEGCWWGDDSVFFNATSGGAAGAGQVWQYRPKDANSGDLILVFESPSSDVLDSPDNICVSPRGGLVICEDGSDEQFVRGLTRQGEIFDFVRSASSDATEFCGACFSPDGRFLFFNTQGSTSSTGTERGGTFAIFGPWQSGAL